MKHRLFARTQHKSLVRQLRTHLLAAVSVLICVLFLFLVVSLGIVLNQYALAQKKAALETDSNAILNAMLDQTTTLRGYVSTPTSAALASFTSSRLAYLSDVERLKEELSTPTFQQTKAALAQVERRYDEWYTHYALVQIANVQSGRLGLARSDQMTTVSRTLFTAFRTAYVQLQSTAADNVRQIQQQLTIMDAVAFAVAVGLEMAAILLFRRTFLRFAIPLRRQLETLKHIAHRLTIGEHAARVPPLDFVELHEVGQSFNQMAQALQVQREELQEQSLLAHKANQVKSQFLASMSHELRTPLNGILGFSELLYDEVAGPMSAEQKEYLNDILTSARHLLGLINDVLDLAKVEAGKILFHPQPVNMAVLVDAVEHGLRPMIAEKRLHVAVGIDPTLSAITIDSARFKQILYNYLSNAIKFTSADGHIHITIKAEGSEMFRLEVQDTGIGIAPEDQERLFGEFQQLALPASVSQQQGSGLGLALTKRLVEAQGGGVGVQSILGQGSRFFAVLPRITTEEPVVKGNILGAQPAKNSSQHR